MLLDIIPIRMRLVHDAIWFLLLSQFLLSIAHSFIEPLFIFFRQLAQEFSDLLKQDRSPVNLAPTHPSRSTSQQDPYSNNSMPLDPSVQRPLTIFSLVTHGFGAPALAAAADVFQMYLSEMLKYYEKNYPMFIATTSSKSDCVGSSLDWVLFLFFFNKYFEICSMEWRCQVFSSICARASSDRLDRKKDMCVKLTEFQPFPLD